MASRGIFSSFHLTLVAFNLQQQASSRVQNAFSREPSALSSQLLPTAFCLRFLHRSESFHVSQAVPFRGQASHYHLRIRQPLGARRSQNPRSIYIKRYLTYQCQEANVSFEHNHGGADPPRRTFYVPAVKKPGRARGCVGRR